MRAFYNDNETFVCDWLQSLMDAGCITPGTIDDRSVEDLRPEDLLGYERVHLFAGIAGWDLALNIAEWGDRPVWTASIPCQPLSSAGKRKGHADRRHLWPAVQRLVAECRPAICFGEQVSSKIGREWFAAVRHDMEHLGYACGAADLPASSVGAPHIRQRLWWVAHADGERQQVQDVHAGPREAGIGAADESRARRGLADARHDDRTARPERVEPGPEAPVRSGLDRDGSIGSRMVDAVGPRLEGHAGDGNRGHEPGRVEAIKDRSVAKAGASGERLGDAEDRERGVTGLVASGRAEGPVGGSGFWGDVVYIPCADGKARPTQPGIFPLAHGVPGRVGALSAYGNAIVPALAAVFIQTVRETLE